MFLPISKILYYLSVPCYLKLIVCYSLITSSPQYFSRHHWAFLVRLVYDCISCIYTVSVSTMLIKKAVQVISVVFSNQPHTLLRYSSQSSQISKCITYFMAPDFCSVLYLPLWKSYFFFQTHFLVTPTPWIWSLS